MTARPGDNAARGMKFALIPALLLWVVIAGLGFALLHVLPDGVLLAIAAGCFLGPLFVWAFRPRVRRVEDDVDGVV